MGTYKGIGSSNFSTNMIEDPDLELVRQCQSEDPDVYEKAFQGIYQKYGERAYNISYRILGNADDALDVTQDAFLSVFKKLSEFRQDSRFFTWFYRIVVNLSIDRRRKLSTTPLAMNRVDGEDVFSELADSRPDSIEQMALREDLEANIQASIIKLSPNLRIVTVLRYIDGMSYAEIAETLACSIGTVKSRLNRAHKMLEQLLRPMMTRKDNEV